jgi:hypothetical protein
MVLVAGLGANVPAAAAWVAIGVVEDVFVLSELAPGAAGWEAHAAISSSMAPIDCNR